MKRIEARAFGFARRRAVAALACSTALMSVAAVAAPPEYHPIQPTEAGKTVTLTGHDLTIDEIVQIARRGAKIEISPAARQRSADAYGLLLEAATEGVPVYWFNRGSGDQREVVIFSGDPLSAENKAKLEAIQLAIFRGSALYAYGPEIADEDVVRAMMAIRANSMTYEAASPGMARMLTELINHRITPVVQSRGTLGEGDLALMGCIGATMVGAGDAYLDGVRMPAAQALQRAGLTPLQPFGADDAALTSTNAYAEAQAALTVADAREALDWADVISAMDLDGMNSSVTPLSMPVQTNRPFRWLNWDAARVLGMVRGSYLLQADSTRIIQDPESLRASTQRQGSAWQAWNQLRRDVLISVNTSDHNPSVRPNVSPTDSWELATPQMMKFFVHGGPESHGQHGYILSNANWDPYPLANDLEAFTIALANMDVAVMLRIERFSNPFFTVMKASDVIKPNEMRTKPGAFGGYTPVDLWQEIQGLEVPVPPEGQAIVATVEDLQGQTRLKATRARQAVDDTFQLLSFDLSTAAFWMDLRRLQTPGREFGTTPTAAWTALRRVQPWSEEQPAPPADQPAGYTVYSFMKSNPASGFLPAGAAPPMDREPLPMAQEGPSAAR